MRAYVSMRGSRSKRSVSRDATPSTRSDTYPYASLTVQPEGAMATASFELVFNVLKSGSVNVELRRYDHTGGYLAVYTCTVNAAAPGAHKP